MPVLFKDLKRGMWVSVICIRDEEAQLKAFDEMPWHRPDRPGYAGGPFKVIEACWPFCLVESRRSDGTPYRRSLDMRNFSVVEVTASYARAWHQHVRPRRRKAAAEPTQAEDAMVCPRCKERLRQRLTAPGAGVWALYCPNCGFEEEGRLAPIKT